MMIRFTRMILGQFWLTIFLSLTLQAQVDIQSPYILNPEANIGFVDSCASFWLNAYDEVDGGFFTNVSENGTPTNTDKFMLTQTRDAYAMARGFQMTGDTRYLRYGRETLDFMYTTYWDSVDDGWDDRQTGKWSFTQHYAMIGIGAMWEATGRPNDYNYLMRGYHSLNDHLWDSRDDYPGYFDRAYEDWTNAEDKGFTPTVDGITTNALPLYLLTGEDIHRERLLQLADLIVEYLVPTMDHYDYGFAEAFDSDWVEENWNSFYFTGHILKSAWCLARAYLVEPNPEYLAAATRILDDVIAQDGTYDYGEWWEWEQAFTAGMMVYYITGDESYLSFADEKIDYFMDTCIDPEYGDVYRGPNSGTGKGDYYKAGYHSTELGYYIYLYSNLYYYKNPASLYYYFEAADSARQITLYPIAIEDSVLHITNVLLDDENFSDFDAGSRILNIAPGIGGVFYVTFENVSVPSSIEHQRNAINPGIFALAQNYPNPFNPTTTINYELPEPSMLSLTVYDVRGHEVTVLQKGVKPAGNYTIQWSGLDQSDNPVSTGLYFCRLEASSFSQTIKMLYLK